jgi:hypothetical protein
MASRRPADRAAAVKAEAARKKMVDALIAAAIESWQEIDSLAIEAAGLIDAAHDRLAAEGYPGIEYWPIRIPARGAWRLLGPTRPVRAGAYPLLEFSFPESHSRRAGIGHIHLLAAYPYLLVRYGTAYSLDQFAALVKKHEGVDRDAKRHPFEPFTLPTFRKIVDALATLAKAPSPDPTPPPEPKRRARPTGTPNRRRLPDARTRLGSDPRRRPRPVARRR